jgi:choline-sulfatase
VVPAHTIVVYLSDNGFLWGEEKGDRGPLHRKKWPYDESIRIPLVLRSLDGTYIPSAAPADLVLNIDLRETLTSAAGVVPTTIDDGVAWGGPGYSARSIFALEQRLSGAGQVVPSYCGVREADWMYVRYQDGIEELYREPDERTNLAGDPAHAAELARLKQAAQALCVPVPPGYTW